MKLPILTKLLVVLLLTSTIPLAIAGYVGYRRGLDIAAVATDTGQEIARLAMSDSTAALSQEEEIDLASRATAVAEDIDAILTRVQADTLELADFATFLYNHPHSVGQYPHPSAYGFGATGAYGSLQPNDNSWLMVSTRGLDAAGQPAPALLAEVALTEFMDVKFRSIAASNPYAVQLYLNTASQITRGMPFVDGEYLWIDATTQFVSDMDLATYDFYYLADAAHNPARTAVWTELYWDPAGQGWMVSSIAPVYVGDDLQGVVGIDITLDTMVNDIINVQLEQTGFAFLMSARGQLLAFPERAAPVLGFSGSLEGEFNDNEPFSFFLTDHPDPTFRAIIAAMRAGASGVTTYQPTTPPSSAYPLPSAYPLSSAAASSAYPLPSAAYQVAYHPVALTGWSVGLVAPYAEVIAPALATNAKIEQNVQAASADLARRSADYVRSFLLIVTGIVGLIAPVAMLVARTISNPIHKLEEGSRRIGSGELSHRIQVHSGDEIEQLALTFNRMADDLQHKITEIEAANAELKKLDEAKSQFISMASHELRTPLIAIQGYVDLLRDGDAGRVTPDQLEMLDTVSRNATRLARIVTELLDLSRIEAKKLVLAPMSFDLATLIAEVAAEQKPVVARRGHTLTHDVQPDLPPLYADRDRIYQVVVNLLGNAIKYTPDGGHLHIRAAAEAGQLHLAVQDNGIGIPPEHLKKVFSRFYTAGDVNKHTTGKEAFMAGGTGLGLPIVQGIVEAHGGQVWVESTAGAGSTFHVSLPLQAPEGVETAVLPPTFPVKTSTFTPAAAPAPANGLPTILVVDDEPEALDVTRQMLAGACQVLTASTSGTGLKAAMTQKPDLILLDAWLPGVSGYDVCQTLKRNVNTRHVPIVIVTAAAQAADEAAAQAAGADGYLTKPFRKADLLRLVGQFVSTPATAPA